MRNDEMEFLLEMMPYIIAVFSIFMVFMFLTLRMIFGRKKEDKKKGKGKHDPSDYDARLDEVIRRAGDLQHRIQNLEDIVAEHKVK